MVEATRWFVILFGITWAAWFGLMAYVVNRARNGDMTRVPILMALSWMGFTVAVARIVVPHMAPDIHNMVNRMFVIVAMFPLGAIVTHTMRRYLPLMAATLRGWLGRG
jgi:hypothetical protein